MLSNYKINRGELKDSVRSNHASFKMKFAINIFNTGKYDAVQAGLKSTGGYDSVE